MIGIVDIGSNSVRLLIAEKQGADFTEIDRHFKTTRLIEGMQDGMPTPAACERTLAAMQEFTRIARSAGCTTVAGFATSAMRDAKNRDELIAHAADFGLAVELLSGEDEARLAYMGCTEEGLAGMIDIGGGSTELVTGENGRVLSCACVPVGAIRLSNNLKGKSPDEILNHAARILEPAWNAVKDSGAANWVGISGTMKALKGLEIGNLDRKAISGLPLTREYTDEIFRRLCAMPFKERLLLPGIDVTRADVLHYGAGILAAFFHVSGVDKIKISDGGDNMLGYARLRFA